MMRGERIFALMLCAGIGLSTAEVEGAYYRVWRAGIDNGNQGEFVQENGNSNSPPGSASLRDDDWYFAGAYPAPIGTLASDSPLNTFERALTSGDPTNRIHFNLDPQEASHGTTMNLVIDVVQTTLPGSGQIPFDVLFNGVNVGSFVVGSSGSVFTTPTFTAGSVNAITGDNVVTLQRTVLDGGWMQFDRIDLNAQVPEPSTAAALLGMALTGLWILRKRVGR